MDFPERIDISKFLPSNYEQPDLLEALERETPVRVSNLNGLLDLPVNPNYTGSKAVFAKSVETEIIRKAELWEGKINDVPLFRPYYCEAVENPSPPPVTPENEIEIHRCDATDEDDMNATDITVSV
jgi:hypothetical protein